MVLQKGGVRAFVPVMNVWGTLELVGGAIYSAVLFRRKQVLRSRMVGNWLIAAGGLLPALGGALVSLNLTQFNYLGIMFGVILIFLGYLQTANAPDDAKHVKPRRAAAGTAGQLMAELYPLLHTLHYWISRAGIVVGLVMLVIAIYIGLIRHGDVTKWFRRGAYAVTGLHRRRVPDRLDDVPDRRATVRGCSPDLRVRRAAVAAVLHLRRDDGEKAPGDGQLYLGVRADGGDLHAQHHDGRGEAETGSVHPQLTRLPNPISVSKALAKRCIAWA